MNELALALAWKVLGLCLFPLRLLTLVGAAVAEAVTPLDRRFRPSPRACSSDPCRGGRVGGGQLKAKVCF